ncbi:hypothetical protein ACE10X_17195 [Bradyrhizobium sp. Pha-3]|uniref:hypothetical protein n=1 Tax=Bradyrhizobium sp. Pha-3 TaxID=208375 RepID=UPI0035D436AB
MNKDDDELSGGENEPHETYEVGYGKPPKATRFGTRPQPVRPNRPLAKHPTPDLAALLERPIEARIGGKKIKLHPHEAVLHGLFKRVVAGEIRAIKLFFEECKRAGLLDRSSEVVNRAVIEVPNGVPMLLGKRLVEHAGPPPWDAELFDKFKAEFERDLAHIEELKKQAKATSQRVVHHDQDI